MGTFAARILSSVFCYRFFHVAGAGSHLPASMDAFEFNEAAVSEQFLTAAVPPATRESFSSVMNSLCFQAGCWDNLLRLEWRYKNSFSLLERADSIVMARIDKDAIDKSSVGKLPWDVLRDEFLGEFGSADEFTVTVTRSDGRCHQFRTSRSNVYAMFFRNGFIPVWFQEPDCGLICLSFREDGDQIDVDLTTVFGQ